MALKDVVAKIEKACADSKFHIGGTASSYKLACKITLSVEERKDLLQATNLNTYDQATFGPWKVSGCKNISADADTCIAVELAQSGNTGVGSTGTPWFTNIGQARLYIRPNSTTIPEFTDWVNSNDGKAAATLQAEVAVVKKPNSYVSRDSNGELQAYSAKSELIPQ